MARPTTKSDLKRGAAGRTAAPQSCSLPPARWLLPQTSHTLLVRPRDCGRAARRPAGRSKRRHSQPLIAALTPSTRGRRYCVERKYAREQKRTRLCSRAHLFVVTRRVDYPLVV